MDQDLIFIPSPAKNLERQKPGEQTLSTPQSHLAEMRKYVMFPLLYLLSFE